MSGDSVKTYSGSSIVKPYIAIIDYGVRNLFSIERACRFVGMECNITSRAELILNADAVILPGVGAFGTAMEKLSRLGLVSVVQEIANSEKIIVGICLGMQLLMTKSCEFGESQGLDLIRGEVLPLESSMEKCRDVKIPHTMWNTVDTVSRSRLNEQSLLGSLPEKAYMYFTHSFYVKPIDNQIVSALTTYGENTFCSAIAEGNIFGFQFHPERSGVLGLQIYKNIRDKLLWSKYSSDQSVNVST